MSERGARDDAFPLRPYLPRDVMALRELFAASIEELTQDDYTEDQRAAWASRAEDAEAFGQRLASAVTLVVEVEGEYLGFATLKDNAVLDMLYVHPYHVGIGVGSALADALERIASARGAEVLTVEASDTSVEFFEGRDYTGKSRNVVPIDDEWLSNTTMTKDLKPAAPAGAEKDA